MVSLSAARIAWGTVLAVVPGPVLSRCPRTRADTAANTVVRVLGARQILQGLAAAAGVVPARWAAVPDALHAATMAGLAVRSDRWRVAACADLAVAGIFGVCAARQPPLLGPPVLAGVISVAAHGRTGRFLEGEPGKPECHG